MILTILLLCGAVLFMLTGAVPLPSDTTTVVFTSPVFIAILGALCVCILVSCRRALSVRRLGFLLSHLSVVVILIGALAGYIFGEKAYVAVPVALGHVVRELPKEEGENIPLDFGVSCSEFVIKYHDPSYNVYRPAGDEQYEYIEEIAVAGRNEAELESGEKIPVSRLRDPEAGGNWREQYVTDAGWILKISRTVRRYGAKLHFHDPSGDEQVSELVVNSPVTFGRWRFYLMSYDHERHSYVWLSARRDPGRGVVIAGFWGLILGTAVLCWFEMSRASRAGEVGNGN